MSFSFVTLVQFLSILLEKYHNLYYSHHSLEGFDLVTGEKPV